ncbi:MAG: excinuclease ABC subunit UvrC [Verrucomicrobiae bacterium]|nr:excinuclease ABC subunit UvrC [Verrucomicrobiae bacterium]MDW8309067.1 excinuclease ABC subunit UvrC [Verrucomicrobiales bacterium]
MALSEHIRAKLSTLPHKPGVYLMKDRLGTVIYVGKARDLRRRVSQYFHPSRRMGWDLKFQALVEAIEDFDVHVVRSEPEALLLETRLIKEFRPRYNVSFRDDKRLLMVKVNLNDPIPNFVLTRLRKDDGARYFGPFASSSALRATLTLMRRQFNLRGCRAYTPGEADYKHCLYAHLKYCTAPCIGNVTREQYLQQVRAACEFLEGHCRELRDQLELEMRKAAAQQDYERAARLRDLIYDLDQTTRKTEKFERVPYSLPLAVDPERDLAALAEVLGLPAPPQRIEAFDISNIGPSFAVGSMVSFKNGRPDRANYRRFRIKTVEGQDDFASMAEVVRRRYTRLLRETQGGDAAGAVEGQHGVAARDEGGEPIPQELQRVVEETRRRVKRGQTAEKEQRGKGAEEKQTETVSSPAPFPDLILIDGGKGQLNAACEELKKLGLERVPVIGLAKEFEEIYLPGRSEPLRPGLDHPAVKLLQRIRDESHRVANSYNAQLRLKKISESVLDEFPGIGERRKTALLKQFGSVQRLRAASVEEIAAVPGIGAKFAAELKAFLDARGSS